MKNEKWIVHPFSYNKAGDREISVIHTTQAHGLQSCGWFNSDKILIAQDSMYGNIEEGAYKVLIEYTEGLADGMNKSEVQPNPTLVAKEKKRASATAYLAKEFNALLAREMAKLND